MEEKIHVQVKDNSPSIERILRPITYVSWLLGVGIAHPRKCSKAVTIIIHIIYMAVWSYVTIRDTQYTFKDDTFFDQNRLMHIKNILFLNRMMCYISTFYYIYYGIRQYNTWPELMNRLEDLDQKISKEISMNDQSIKIVEALAIFITFIFWSLMSIFSVLHDYLYFSFPVDEIFIIDMIFNYILVQSLMNSFVFDVVVYVIYHRFQTLNKLICQLDKSSDVQLIAFKIRRIRELHADICDLASMVNDIHGLHLLFCFGNCFTMAVTTLYSLFFLAKDINPFELTIFLLYIVYSIQFCLICWICTLTYEESNGTGRIIYKIILNWKPVNLDKNIASNPSNLEVRSSLENSSNEQNSNWNSSHNPYVVENFLRRNLDRECVTKEVNDFSTQLLQNRVAFTACDFFEINNASYGWFVGVIVTYLIIILQLYLPDFEKY